MALVNISQAARMSGKSRMTVHRRIKEGELSIQNGLVDTSELMRVFGSLVTSDRSVPRGKPDTAKETKVQLEVLQAKYDSLQRELALKDALLEEKDKRLALLEYRPVTTEKSLIKTEKDGRLRKLARFVLNS
jgi:hypothetical protein